MARNMIFVIPRRPILKNHLTSLAVRSFIRRPNPTMSPLNQNTINLLRRPLSYVIIVKYV